VDEKGKKHLIAIEDGTRESTQSWRDVLLAAKARGLNAAKLATGDGALGFWAALSEVFPSTTHQRCWMHKASNVLNYLPRTTRSKAQKRWHRITAVERLGELIEGVRFVDGVAQLAA
jgi:putative transposase